MLEIAVQTTGGLPRDAERIVEDVCMAAGLSVRLRGALKKYRGCKHWHFGKSGATGTLEVTLWRERGRLWLSVQSGRRAAWIDAAAAVVKRKLERRLAGTGGARS